MKCRFLFAPKKANHFFLKFTTYETKKGVLLIEIFEKQPNP